MKTQINNDNKRDRIENRMVSRTQSILPQQDRGQFFDRGVVSKITVTNSLLDECFVNRTLVLAIAVLLLFAFSSANAATQGQELQIDFTFDSAAVPDKDVSGYRLYMDEVLLCETTNVETASISCPIDAEAGTYSFTLSALFDDGSESPQSVPFPFTLTDFDSDNDGIADSWEQTYFGNLTTANAGTDYDNDGYTDLQEYLNDAATEVDPYGTSFNPTIANALGGAGYLDFPADSLVVNLPGYGLYTYNTTSLLKKINTLQSNLTVTADIDSDGVDEIVSFFDGHGLYVWDNGIWVSRINTLKPEAMIKFGDKIAIDFGIAYGLYIYNTTQGYTRISSLDSTLITEVDADSDGVMELAAYFPGYGLCIRDNEGWARISKLEPENIVKFGNGLAIDFGSAYGLYTYSTTERFTRISSLDSTLITEVDADSDGVMELAAYFPGYGLYIRDSEGWTKISKLEPENIVKVGNRLAIDFGPAYGLYTYSSTERFTRISSLDSTLMAEVDVDSDGVMELAASFPGYGLYVRNDGLWSRLTALSVDLMTAGNILE